MTAKVHSVRLYHLEPRGIKCMSYSPEIKLLALARDDNSIEIWNLQNAPHIQLTITDAQGTVEALSWYKKRLFSVGRLGAIIEYDLFLLIPSSMHPLTSGSSWCIDICPLTKQLAAGTEDGYINIFNIDDEGIMYDKLFDKQEGRVVCLIWDSKGEYIVSGSEDTVRVWNAKTGHAVHRLICGRNKKKVPTMVWSVAVTSDFTVISGDSRGKLSFWDGVNGIAITSYQSHKADVLSVCLAEDENTVYCAGVDPLIASYERVQVRDSDERGKWVKSIQRVIHDHDVRSLMVCDKKLYSAGVDGYLACSSYPPKVLYKYPPLLQHPSVSVACEAKYLLMKYPKCIVLWKLVLPQPIKLLRWENADQGFIKCSAISNDGAWVACSTSDKFRLLRLELVNEIPLISKVKIPTKLNLKASCLCFSTDNTRLVVGTIKGGIYVLSIENNSLEVLEKYYPHKENHMNASLKQVDMSHDKKFLVASDTNSNIVVWCNGKLYTKLPKYSSPMTAAAIQPETNNLVIVYADQKLVEYSLENMKYTKFSKELNTYPKPVRNFPVYGITFCPRDKDIIILNDDSTILVLNKKKEIVEPATKFRKMPSDEDGIAKNLKDKIKIIKKFKHIVYFGCFGDDELVAVELPPASLTDSLPKNFKQKLFGRK